uniref:De novo design protein -NA7 n=1 Tax=synthetic construct TaxID=32630 RepID=UPI0034E05747
GKEELEKLAKELSKVWPELGKLVEEVIKLIEGRSKDPKAAVEGLIETMRRAADLLIEKVLELNPALKDDPARTAALVERLLAGTGEIPSFLSEAGRVLAEAAVAMREAADRLRAELAAGNEDLSAAADEALAVFVEAVRRVAAALLEHHHHHH